MKRYRISLFVLPLDYVKRTAVHKQLSAAEKEHILDSPFTEVTKTEGMPNFSFTPALRSSPERRSASKSPNRLELALCFCHR
jgi:hypothetical protein